jgi:hypothetical protein
MDFQLLQQRRPEGKPSEKMTTGSCPNVEPDFRSLSLIRPNLQPIYQEDKGQERFAPSEKSGFVGSGTGNGSAMKLPIEDEFGSPRGMRNEIKGGRESEQACALAGE